MNSHRFRVPVALCQADDGHFLRRRLIPLRQYSQDIFDCWNTQRGLNRFLSERAILKQVKLSGLLRSVKRLCDLRRLLLKHKRLACNAKVLPGKYRIEEARKVKDEACRLDPTVKVLAVVSGALVTCKGNHFRRRYAYREGADHGACIIHFVPFAKDALPHDAEENALAIQAATLCQDHPGRSVRDALEVIERQGWNSCRHVMPNVNSAAAPAA